MTLQYIKFELESRVDGYTAKIFGVSNSLTTIFGGCVYSHFNTKILRLLLKKKKVS